MDGVSGGVDGGEDSVRTVEMRLCLWGRGRVSYISVASFLAKTYEPSKIFATNKTPYHQTLHRSSPSLLPSPSRIVHREVGNPYF